MFRYEVKSQKRLFMETKKKDLQQRIISNKEHINFLPPQPGDIKIKTLVI